MKPKSPPDPGSAPFVPDDAERIHGFIREQAMHTRDLPGETPCQRRAGKAAGSHGKALRQHPGTEEKPRLQAGSSFSTADREEQATRFRPASLASYKA
jgi:hypothetical protein